MVFALSERNYLGDRATIVQVADPEIPVISVAVSTADSPFDVGRFTENAVKILNGEEPLHDISGGNNRIYWHNLGKNGVEFRSQEGGKGLTKPGISFIVNEGCPGELAADVLAKLQNPANLKALCDKVSSAGQADPKPAPSKGL